MIYNCTVIAVVKMSIRNGTSKGSSLSIITLRDKATYLGRVWPAACVALFLDLCSHMALWLLPGPAALILALGNKKQSCNSICHHN